jgi:hypothetical protein
MCGLTDQWLINQCISAAGHHLWQQHPGRHQRLQEADHKEGGGEGPVANNQPPSLQYTDNRPAPSALTRSKYPPRTPIQKIQQVEGIPPTTLVRAAQEAAEAGHAGATAQSGPWLFNLDAPTYV